MIGLVQLAPSEWQRLRSIRLRALQDAPDAFGSTFEEANDWAPDRWVRQLTSLPTFVAVSDDVDVGMVRFELDDTRPETAWLISMWVAPEARRAGVGSVLVDAVIDWARTHVVRRLLLDVADSNAPAIALYAAKGFTATGEVGTLPSPRLHIREHRRERLL